MVSMCLTLVAITLKCVVNVLLFVPGNTINTKYCFKDTLVINDRLKHTYTKNVDYLTRWGVQQGRCLSTHISQYLVSDGCPSLALILISSSSSLSSSDMKGTRALDRSYLESIDCLRVFAEESTSRCLSKIRSASKYKWFKF